jgi:hypothetical protein
MSWTSEALIAAVRDAAANGISAVDVHGVVEDFHTDYDDTLLLPPSIRLKAMADEIGGWMRASDPERSLNPVVRADQADELLDRAFGAAMEMSGNATEDEAE